MKKVKTLAEKYPPSKSCSCDICKSYCLRPGWWTVDQAKMAINEGYGSRMMLELAPEMNFAVLSPAFRGCEQSFALQEFSSLGCNFLKDGICEIHDKDFLPLECAYCHHSRKGMGIKCHADIEQDWKTLKGQILVKQWIEKYIKK